MSGTQAVLELQDLDDLLALVSDRDQAARLKRMGFTLEGREALLERRAEIEAGLERRWWLAYERAAARWGRGLTAVRAKVCQGCFVTLPTSAQPAPGGSLLHVCQGCGRLLWWR